MKNCICIQNIYMRERERDDDDDATDEALMQRGFQTVRTRLWHEQLDRFALGI